MKSFSLLVALWCVALAGCGAIADATGDLRGRWSAREEGRSQTYAASMRATYEAVQVAAAQMGYRVVRGGVAQGQFEAVSAVGSGDAHGSSRQITLRVRLKENPQGGVDLNVRFTEILELDSANRPGQATATPLKDSPQYRVFLRTVEQALRVAE